MSMFAFSAPAARAQQAEAPKQPVVYTYVSFFGVPRAQWAAYEKNAGDRSTRFSTVSSPTERSSATATALWKFMKG